MSELPRLKHDDDLAGSLLRAADDDAPAPRSRAAISAALGLSAGAGLGVGSAKAAGSAAKSTLVAKLGSSVALKVTAVVVAVGATVGVHHAITRRAAEPTVSSPAAPPAAIVAPRAAELPRAPEPPRVVVEPPPERAAPPIVEQAAPAPLAVPAPAPRKPAPVARVAAPPPASTPPPPPTAESPPAPPPPSLGDELALLESAVSALHHHDAPGALAALDAYDRKFPAGKLAPEATVARIEATLAQGDTARARELAARFLADHAASPLAPRVRALVTSP